MPPSGCSASSAACHVFCSSSLFLMAAYSVFFAIPLKKRDRKKSIGCPCFCSPAGRCGLRLDFIDSLRQVGKPCVVRSGLSCLLQKKAKDHASPSLLHSIRAPSFLGLSPGSTLAPLAGGSQPPFVPLSGGLAVRAITLRSTASGQPFSSRLFFLRLPASFTHRSDPQLEKKSVVDYSSKKNKKGSKYKFQADKKARVKCTPLRSALAFLHPST